MTSVAGTLTDRAALARRILLLVLLVAAAGIAAVAVMLLDASRADAGVLDPVEELPVPAPVQDTVAQVDQLTEPVTAPIEPVARPPLETVGTTVDRTVTDVQDGVGDVPVVGGVVEEVTDAAGTALDQLPAPDLPALPPAPQIHLPALEPPPLPSLPIASTLGGPALADAVAGLERSLSPTADPVAGPPVPVLDASTGTTPSFGPVAIAASAVGGDVSAASTPAERPVPDTGTPATTERTESTSPTRELRPDLRAVVALVALLLLAVRRRGSPAPSYPPRLLYAEALARPG